MGSFPLGDVRSSVRKLATECPVSYSYSCTFHRVTALSYQKGGLIKVPWAPFPTVDRDVHRHIWTNYPVSSETTKSHEQCLFKAVCDVSLITYDLSWSLFGSGDKERKLDASSVQAAEEAYARLQKWYEELPDCLETGNATPHVLSLQFVFKGVLRKVGYC